MPKKRFHNVIIFRPLEPLTRLYAGMHMQKSMNPNYGDLSLSKTLRSYLPELHESLQKYEHWSIGVIPLDCKYVPNYCCAFALAMTDGT